MIVAKILREVFAVAVRILTELLRRKRSLIFWSVFPVLILALNGLIMEEQAQLTRVEAFRQEAPPTLVGAALFLAV